MRKALEPGTRRMISAVNYTEVLIGPLRHAGAPGAEHSRRDARSLRHGDNPGRPGPRPTRCRGAGSNASQAAGCVRIGHRYPCGEAWTWRRPPRNLRRESPQGVQGAPPDHAGTRIAPVHASAIGSPARSIWFAHRMVPPIADIAQAGTGSTVRMPSKPEAMLVGLRRAISRRPRAHRTAAWLGSLRPHERETRPRSDRPGNVPVVAA
jgi:hypothetical protein